MAGQEALLDLWSETLIFYLRLAWWFAVAIAGIAAYFYFGSMV